jgi:hypothetical protein
MMRAHFLQRAKDGLIELLDALLALATKPLLEPAEILDAFPDVLSFTHAATVAAQQAAALLRKRLSTG